MIRSLCIKDFYWFCWTSCFFGKSNFQAGLISELSPQTHSQLEIYHKKSLSFPSIPGIPGTLSNRLKTSSLGWWMVASTVFCVAVPSPRAKPCSSFITLSLGQCQVNRALKFEVYEVGYAMVDLENWWWGWWWWWWWWWCWWWWWWWWWWWCLMMFSMTPLLDDYWECLLGTTW